MLGGAARELRRYAHGHGTVLWTTISRTYMSFLTTVDKPTLRTCSARERLPSHDLGYPSLRPPPEIRLA